MSLKQRILSYLQRNYPAKISSGDIQRLAMEAGYFASNATRRLRELENEGSVMVSYGEKNAASYQYKPKYDDHEKHLKIHKLTSFEKDSMREVKKHLEIFTPAPVCPPEKIQTKLI